MNVKHAAMTANTTTRWLLSPPPPNKSEGVTTNSQTSSARVIAPNKFEITFFPFKLDADDTMPTACSKRYKDTKWCENWCGFASIRARTKGAWKTMPYMLWFM